MYAVPAAAIAEHPCFSAEAHFRVGRIHLPVAPACNIRCAYCDRRCDCPNESRPGVASRLLSPAEAVLVLRRALGECSSLGVVGIAGPGEPLANGETFATLRLVREHFPQLSPCVSTNGLALAEALDDLVRYGVKTLTVTVNTLRPETARQIYTSELPLETFLRRQQEGVRLAVRRGLVVKINTVLIPGINSDQAGEIAQFARAAGASIMNLIPLIPCGEMAEWPPPTEEMIQEARLLASRYIRQFTHCRRCRADACGIPGQKDGKWGC